MQIETNETALLSKGLTQRNNQILLKHSNKSSIAVDKPYILKKYHGHSFPCYFKKIQVHTYKFSCRVQFSQECQYEGQCPPIASLPTPARRESRAACTVPYRFIAASDCGRVNPMSCKHVVTGYHQNRLSSEHVGTAIIGQNMIFLIQPVAFPLSFKMYS